MSASDRQGVRDAAAPANATGARPDEPERRSGAGGLIQRVLELRIVRVLQFFGSRNGSLLASGLAYQGIFALFAALWFTFSLAGFVITDDPPLQHAFVRSINSLVPGLIGQKGSTGSVITIDQLLTRTTLGVSTVIALLSILWTAVGFLSSLRSAIRMIFDLPALRESFLLLKLKDLGLAVAFGALVLLTAAVSIVTAAASNFLLGLLGITSDSWFANGVSFAIGFVVIAALDVVILAAAIHVLSGVPVPRRRLLAGGLLGGVILALLQTVGSGLLGAPKNNPLFASFAVIFGLFVYFNIVCTVILIAASWVAVGMRDVHLDPRGLSPEDAAADRARRVEEARRLIADADREALEERIRNASGWRRDRLARLLRREVRREADRRRRVPTESTLRAGMHGDDGPDAPSGTERGGRLPAADDTEIELAQDRRAEGTAGSGRTGGRP